jgi:hypothetical protein
MPGDNINMLQTEANGHFFFKKGDNIKQQSEK